MYQTVNGVVEHNTSVGSSQSLEGSEVNGGEARFAPTLGLTFIMVSFLILLGIIALKDFAFMDEGSTTLSGHEGIVGWQDCWHNKLSVSITDIGGCHVVPLLKVGLGLVGREGLFLSLMVLLLLIFFLFTTLTILVLILFFLMRGRF